MTTFSRFIVRVADLAEAEGRSLRKNATSLASSIVLVAGAVVLCLGGIFAVLAGLWLLLSESMGSIGACFVVGVLAIGMGLGLAWNENRKNL